VLFPTCERWRDVARCQRDEPGVDEMRGLRPFYAMSSVGSVRTAYITSQSSVGEEKLSRKQGESKFDLRRQGYLEGWAFIHVGRQTVIKREKRDNRYSKWLSRKSGPQLGLVAISRQAMSLSPISPSTLTLHLPPLLLLALHLHLMLLQLPLHLSSCCQSVVPSMFRVPYVVSWLL